MPRHDPIPDRPPRPPVERVASQARPQSERIAGQARPGNQSVISQARPQSERVAGQARPQSERAGNWARFRRTMGWMALAAIVSVLLALIYLKSFGDPVPLHMQIATILGVGFMVLVGTGLMALVFLSSRSGHDEEATFGDWNDDATFGEYHDNGSDRPR